MVRNNLIEQLHTVCNHFAPNAEAQIGLVKLRNELDKAGEPDRVVAIQLAAALHSGLAYGNWPFVPTTSSK